MWAVVLIAKVIVILKSPHLLLSYYVNEPLSYRVNYALPYFMSFNAVVRLLVRLFQRRRFRYHVFVTINKYLLYHVRNHRTKVSLAKQLKT